MFAHRYIVGIDVGGTFTDAVVLDVRTGELRSAFKLPSTPDDPGRAVVEAVDRIARDFDIVGALVCHGTTVGTNALIERRGARTALLATRGFADVLELRRQARPQLYDLTVEISEPLVSHHDRLEVDERVGADGTVLEPLRVAASLLEALRARDAEAVAVCLLHSYANPEHEARLVDAIRQACPNLYVTASSDVCPEFREYERTSTAVVNAYIGPTVSRYMGALNAGLSERGIGRLMVVKSNGGLTSPANASRYPVHLIESGPAAGLAAAAAYARASDRKNLLAFDMGGTTAKAGLIRNGEPETSAEFYADRLVEGRNVGGYAIRSTVLDIVEIGAGGGSIAEIDEAGILKVGPRSAGADPGPACYGRGGQLPTVTDAHAVIGTLDQAIFEGAGVAFDPRSAEDAILRHVAAPLGWSLARAAYAIIDIAVANMVEMVRLTTVQRGVDPRDYAMLASGGAGPLHASLIAGQIGMPEVVIPPYPGMFSAIGAMLGQIRHEVVKTHLRPVDELTTADLNEAFEALGRRAEVLLRNEPDGPEPAQLHRFVDARFAGQLFELKLAFGVNQVSPKAIEASFRAAYRAEYGFDLPDADVQVVNLRLVVSRNLLASVNTLFAEQASADVAHHDASRTIDLLNRDGIRCPVDLAQVRRGVCTSVSGPAVIAHEGSTVWIHEDQQAYVAADGRIRIKIGTRP